MRACVRWACIGTGGLLDPIDRNWKAEAGEFFRGITTVIPFALTSAVNLFLALQIDAGNVRIWMEKIHVGESKRNANTHNSNRDNEDDNDVKYSCKISNYKGKRWQYDNVMKIWQPTSARSMAFLSFGFFHVPCISSKKESFKASIRLCPRSRLRLIGVGEESDGTCGSLSMVHSGTLQDYRKVFLGRNRTGLLFSAPRTLVLGPHR